MVPWRRMFGKKESATNIACRGKLRRMSHLMSRRSFLGLSTSVFGAALLSRNSLAALAPEPAFDFGVGKSLDVFAQDYMRMMRAPGMTIALVAEDHSAKRVYRYSNVEAKIPVAVDQPFWIGSICKSFVGLVAMQLRDEGKLDLHKPVLEIMPDLPFRNDFGAITVHHLLTHTSGLPNWLGLIGSDSSQIAAQTYKPGERFAYCNLGYDTLGRLIAHIDGRSWPEAVTARILKPLGMTASSGQIDDATQARMPIGYHFQYLDRPNTVADPLIAVGYVQMSNAAGSIAATADDMAKYMHMLTLRGKGPAGRIVSEEGFRLFSTPYVKAPVLSASSSYGYGIGVETIGGRTMLRHTGGATAFASSILVDIDSGIGAFASINSMQGYRPNPVTKFGVDLLYARKLGKTLPPAPPIEDPLIPKNPQEYAGTYKTPNGDTWIVSVKGKELSLASTLGHTILRPIGPDAFSAADGAVLGDEGKPHAHSEFALVFGRPGSAGVSGAVNDITYGTRWYSGSSYSGHHEFTRVENAVRYVGMYSIDSPWTPPMRVLERNGKLWLDGTDELHPIGADHFSVEGGEGTMELEFAAFVDGRAQVLRLLGDVLHRVSLGPTA
jgi:D-alanyl-D-alanine carboxypeptidase